ncbi:MAG: hypothetical protein ACD_5C00253G0007 [uncultured bacterium]|nr:MAG: hypothetical protein ACD_5C00253G0007 [uncultured bacterium]
MDINKINQIIRSTKDIEPSGNLKFLIMERIKKAEQQKLLRRLLMLRFGMGLSFITIVSTFYFGGREFMVSEFWNVAMLGFSDFDLVFNNWQSFGWSLLENLPVFSILVLSVPILILMVLGREYENVPRAYKFKF